VNSQNFLLVKRNRVIQRKETQESQPQSQRRGLVLLQQFLHDSVSVFPYTVAVLLALLCSPTNLAGLVLCIPSWHLGSPMIKLQNSPKEIEILRSPQIRFSYTCLWFQFVFHHISTSNRVSYIRCIWCKIVCPFSS